MALDPFAPAVFAFCNRRRDRMKILFFDRSGFVLVLKRLTEDRFRWPRRHETVVRLTTEQLHWILDGIDIDAMVRHPVRQYRLVYTGRADEITPRTRTLPRLFQIADDGDAHDWINRIGFPKRQSISDRVSALNDLLESLERPKAFATDVE